MKVSYVHLKILRQYELPDNTTLPSISDDVVIDDILYVVSNKVWTIVNTAVHMDGHNSQSNVSVAIYLLTR